jgi:hypothetical protein
MNEQDAGFAETPSALEEAAVRPSTANFAPEDVGRMVSLCPECMGLDGAHMLDCNLGKIEDRRTLAELRAKVEAGPPISVLGPVAPGSIVCLPESMFETAEEGDDALDAHYREVMGQLAAKVGHNDFLVLVVGSADTGIAHLGRDEVKGLLRELLGELGQMPAVGSGGDVRPFADGLGLTRVGVEVPLNKTVEAFVPCGLADRHAPHVWDETETTCKACTGAATVLADAG